MLKMNHLKIFYNQILLAREGRRSNILSFQTPNPSSTLAKLAATLRSCVDPRNQISFGIRFIDKDLLEWEV